MTIKVTTAVLLASIAALLAALSALGAGNIYASIAFFLSSSIHFISYVVIKHDESKKSGDDKNVPSL